MKTKKRKGAGRPPTPAQWKIPYEISGEPLDGLVTGHGGVAVTSRAFRGMKLPGACNANLGALRKINRGRTPGEVVESAVVAVLQGADCVGEIDIIREDPAVERMLGYSPASSRSVRDWLEKCHDKDLVEESRKRAEELDLKASVPEDTPGLAGLQRVLGTSAREAAARLPRGSLKVCTVDLDATTISSDKRSALFAYTDERGYQSVVAVWAEAMVVLAAEFCDGNVPANIDPLDCARKAFAELPAGIETLGFRGDSACDNQDLLDWLDDSGREGGPEGEILYAISARMTTSLAEVARDVPDSGWATVETRPDGTAVQLAELAYTPSLPVEKKDVKPRRHVGIRILKPQGELFGDGNDRKHFAVVTNRRESAKAVVQWQREKAGTVEHTHDEMKNALAAGRLPSQKFGANAAWMLINAIAYNVAAAVRSTADDPDRRCARIKSMRFDLLRASARLTRFSRKITLRFAGTKEWVARILKLLEAFPCKVQPTG